jgi:hypothetical protein
MTPMPRRSMEDGSGTVTAKLLKPVVVKLA